MFLEGIIHKTSKEAETKSSLQENSPEDRFDKLDAAEIAIAGAGSGLITRAVIQPFDVLKIRFQLQVEPISKHVSSKYKSMPQAFSLIYREEGLPALWKGHIPAQMLSITFGLVQFWSFESMVKVVKKYDIYRDHKLMSDFCMGAISGTAASVASFPFDLIRTRLCAQGKDTKIYNSTIHAVALIIKHEGYAGLYKGLLPTIIAVAPSTGAAFMFYKLFDHLYRRITFHDENSYSMTSSLIAGSLSGVCSKTIIYPLDLARRRMQIQGFQKFRRKFGANFVCFNFRDCIIKIGKEEGPKGFFKGLAPSIVKALLASALNFTSFEMVCNFLHKMH